MARPKPSKKKEEGKHLLLVLVPTFTILAITGVLAIGVGAYVIIHNSPKPAEAVAPEIITSSTSTTTTTSTTTSTSTTSTTILYATTTLCGGDFQEPCEEGGCDFGFIIGSGGICKPRECAPSVSSGRGGCGAFAMSYCVD